MCGAPAFGETITPKSLAAEQLKKTSSGWSPRTFLTMPFPVCKDCHRIHNRMRLTGLLGGLIGFFAGLIVLIGLFLAGAFFPLAELADFAGVPNSKLVLPLIIIFSPAVTAWGLTLNSRFVLRQVPKEKQPFFRTVGNNKGIRVLGYSNGTFAFGFLNREFATLFQKLNGGVAASVGTNAEETT